MFRLDNKSHGRASMSSEPKVGPESDTDSMAEYGDGDTGNVLLLISFSLSLLVGENLQIFCIDFGFVNMYAEL